MAKKPKKGKAAPSPPPAPAEPSPPGDIEIIETTAVPDPQNGFQRAQRIPILGEAHGEVTVFQPVIIKEISRTGANVQTAFPLHLNSLHDFRLMLGDRSVIIKGRVVHCSIADVEQEGVLYRSGIEFVEPSERVDAAISGFIANLVEQRSKGG
ncbi:MAG TPA: PilZ domain-containing protein [Vicinamibacterales bacterium]|nr:PilZ domain-containing protein [Vicinamibacterales bacterium]